MGFGACMSKMKAMLYSGAGLFFFKAETDRALLGSAIFSTCFLIAEMLPNATVLGTGTFGNEAEWKKVAKLLVLREAEVQLSNWLVG